MNRFFLFTKKSGNFTEVGISCITLDSAIAEAIKCVKGFPAEQIYVFEEKAFIKTGEPTVTKY